MAVNWLKKNCFTIYFCAIGSTTASVESVVGKSEGKLQGKEGLQVHLPTNEKLEAGPHCKLLVYQFYISFLTKS